MSSDADVTGGRGRPAVDGPDLPGGRRQRRGVLRHSVGRGALLPDTGQRAARFSDPLPTPVIRSAMRVVWWLYWRVTKEAEDAQRRELGLPKATASAGQRIVRTRIARNPGLRRACFPGLAAEWQWNGRRPFVGRLTMELPTDADDEVASWIAAGTPPIYFGFGSMPIESPADTVAMISAACAELGERALICSGASDFNRIPHSDHVKVVGPVNHAAIFPACRAVVHHGGAGTTAAGMRAGIPTLILWDVADQPVWAAQVKRLKVGSARRFSGTTQKSLVADLRSILAPQYAARAREFADPDDQTRCRRYQGRRSAGRCRPPERLRWSLAVSRARACRPRCREPASRSRQWPAGNVSPATTLGTRSRVTMSATSAGS